MSLCAESQMARDCDSILVSRKQVPRPAARSCYTLGDQVVRALRPIAGARPEVRIHAARPRKQICPSRCVWALLPGKMFQQRRPVRAEVAGISFAPDLFILEGSIVGGRSRAPD